MLSKDWSKFKSGSDIRGVALEGVKDMPIDLTDEIVERMAAGFGVWLVKKLDKPAEQLKISIGHDSRLSGPRMKAAVIRALKRAGFTCYDFSLMSTPGMFMSCVNKDLSCDGAIQLTASHHPFNRNGLKFFTKDGGLEGSDIAQILTYAQDNASLPQKEGKVISYDFLSVYAQGLVETVRKGVNSKTNYEKPLAGFKVVVDAGNGAGGFYVQKVLEPLGADTSGSQFLEPDGSFPNHIPNPENEEAMHAITRAVLNSRADIGLIFDTDVDRAGAVDSTGREINRNRLIALISAILLEETPGATIVTDSITSSGLKLFIENKLGGKHHRFKRGYKNVINEAIRLNSEGIYCPLAIETSGHAALKENYFLDDGAYLVTKLLIKMARLKEEGKKLDNLLDGLAEPVESKEIRMNLLLDDFKQYGQKIIDEITAFAAKAPGWIPAQDNYEGIRVAFGKNDGDGWFLLRLSLHDPLMPLNIESDSAGGVKIIAEKLYDAIKQYDKLDTAPLKNFIDGAN